MTRQKVIQILLDSNERFAVLALMIVNRTAVEASSTVRSSFDSSDNLHDLVWVCHPGTCGYPLGLDLAVPGTLYSVVRPAHLEGDCSSDASWLHEHEAQRDFVSGLCSSTSLRRAACLRIRCSMRVFADPCLFLRPLTLQQSSHLRLRSRATRP